MPLANRPDFSSFPTLTGDRFSKQQPQYESQVLAGAAEHCSSSQCSKVSCIFVAHMVSLIAIADESTLMSSNCGVKCENPSVVSYELCARTCVWTEREEKLHTYCLLLFLLQLTLRKFCMSLRCV